MKESNRFLWIWAFCAILSLSKAHLVPGAVARLHRVLVHGVAEGVVAPVTLRPAATAHGVRATPVAGLVADRAGRGRALAVQGEAHISG